MQESLTHILGMFFLFYLALGASVFSAIESPIEKKEIKDLIAKKQEFLESNECIEGKYYFILLNSSYSIL